MSRLLWPFDNKLNTCHFSFQKRKALNNYAKTITFETGKAKITADSGKVIADIIAILKEYPQSRFMIEGHTDSTGPAKLNESISDKRANSVRDYLISNGIDASRLEAKGFGESKPIDTNNTRAGRAKNRRVEINLIKNDE